MNQTSPNETIFYPQDGGVLLHDGGVDVSFVHMEGAMVTVTSLEDGMVNSKTMPAMSPRALNWAVLMANMEMQHRIAKRVIH